MKITEC